ncbi:MAG: hypothetical protein R3185_07375 [Candidatus Thermoplasmatota archaeon]|nr:hypothetical protein [Candidatus Thermoplasmatota archaeon]
MANEGGSDPRGRVRKINQLLICMGLLLAMAIGPGFLAIPAGAHAGESCGEPEPVEAFQTVTGVLSEENPSDWYVRTSAAAYLLIDGFAGIYHQEGGRSVDLFVWNEDCTELLCTTDGGLLAPVYAKSCVLPEDRPILDEERPHVLEVRLMGSHVNDRNAYTLQLTPT